jgi:hypothetical protein
VENHFNPKNAFCALFGRYCLARRQTSVICTARAEYNEQVTFNSSRSLITAEPNCRLSGWPTYIVARLITLIAPWQDRDPSQTAGKTIPTGPSAPLAKQNAFGKWPSAESSG